MNSLALCLICKGDELEELNRLLKSVEPYVDHVFITTTKVQGKIKDTKKISVSHFAWCDDFAQARNYNFSQAKAYKWLMWLDSDDVLVGGDTLREVVEEMDKHNLDAVFADYNYEIDENTGEIIIVHPRERIVRNGVYEWKAPLHETLIPKRQTNTLFIHDFVVNHYPSQENRAANGERNLRILSSEYNKEVKEVQEGKRTEIDPRTEYYLGRCLFDTHTNEGFNKAGDLFQDYLEHSGWDEERAQCWNYLGHIFYHFGKNDDAVNCYLSAIKERPEFPTWYMSLGRTYAAMKQFDKAQFYIEQGLNIPQPHTGMVISPFEDKINALFTLFVVYFNKKDMKKALSMAQKLYELQPSKENKGKVDSCKQLIKWSEWLKATNGMLKSLKADKQTEKIEKLLANLPDEVQNTAYTDRLRIAYLPPKVWSKKSIVYYAASDFEPWSPQALQTGIGGSEEAIIYLSKEWTKLGYEVTVFANCGTQEGIYDGVEYKNYQRFNPKDYYNILIGWRNPLFFKNTIKAKLKLLDLHDVPMPEEFTQDVLDAIDYIMVKSQYHRSLLPNVPDNKFKIIGNGIDLQLINKAKGKNKRYKLFWGSSYDRGLHDLLKMWSDIKKAEPLAELHICYGWNLYESLYAHVPHMMKWKHEMEELMKQPGITHHGRVGKQELYDIAKDCGIWAYPTNFEEISCITAMYCQALGTYPVTFDYAALTTTILHGYKDKYRDLQHYKEALIRAIETEYPTKDLMIKDAQVFSWTNVAKEWDSVFKQSLPLPLVSIITPTIRTGFWNVMASNISNQTYKNIEWIVVDDYKQDRQEIANKYANKYGITITYLRGKERATKRRYGLVNANNTGLAHAKGELLVFLQDFILMPENGIEQMVELYRYFPNSLQAPTDKYYKFNTTPDMTNSDDWFNGKTDVRGELLWENCRNENKGLRWTKNDFDFEMNYCAIPTRIARQLHGWWEFMDDGLGYDNTEIAMRAMRLGYSILIDEHNLALCFDLWQWLRGSEENVIDREWNLNDPRFVWYETLMQTGKMPVIRDEKLDNKISLPYEIPKTTTQEGASQWMKDHLEEIINKWLKEVQV